MLSIPLLLVAGGLIPTLIEGLPVSSGTLHFLEGRESSTAYAVFAGNGEPSDGWPLMSDWVPDFDTMFAAQYGIMSTSCSQFGAPDNSDAENAEISTAIKSVGASTGVDPRFILAIVMQESNGCVRAPTTSYGVTNPGLMQSHNGNGTCNIGSTVQNPCPQSEVTQMITDGTDGTSYGPGLKQLMAQSGATDVSMYYKAARMYNSGSIDSSGNLGAGIATHCYASDIANRLIGWSAGFGTCDENTIGSLTTSEPFVSGASNSSGSSASSSAAGSATTTSNAASVATSSAPASSSPAASSVAGGAFVQEPTAASSAAPAPSAQAASAAPQPAATSSTPSSSSVAPASTGIVGTGSAISAGTPCTTEGMWNCIGADSFQQCSSGTWSVVGQLAAGTSCTSGQVMDIDIVASNSTGN